MRDVLDEKPAAELTKSTAALLRQLRQLIDAIDRRVPHIERNGEAQIARDARALKEKAL